MLLVGAIAVARLAVLVTFAALGQLLVAVLTGALVCVGIGVGNTQVAPGAVAAGAVEKAEVFHASTIVVIDGAVNSKISRSP